MYPNNVVIKYCHGCLKLGWFFLNRWQWLWTSNAQFVDKEWWTMIGLQSMLVIGHGQFTISIEQDNQGEFTHETEGPWPLHSKISHWSKRSRPSESLHTIRWGPKGPKNFIVDEKSTWVLTWHQKITFNGLPKFASCPPPRGRPDANSSKPCHWYEIWKESRALPFIYSQPMARVWNHFTHEIDIPWPLHFKHSHWWKRRSRSKFAIHATFEGPTEDACECKMDVKFRWIPTWHRLDHVSWSLGLFSKITSWR